MQYYEVSAKSNYQFEKPFIWLLKKLFGDPNLGLVEAPALRPIEIAMDPAQIAEIEKELQEAENDVLPDADDEFKQKTQGGPSISWYFASILFLRGPSEHKKQALKNQHDPLSSQQHLCIHLEICVVFKKPRALFVQFKSDILFVHLIWKFLAVYSWYPPSNPLFNSCLLYTSPSPRDGLLSRMPSSA
eukprot:TRINITY_DN374_c0_g1_i4.p1 TRINITY_DN374_c0_g1~~TRINITY_DN374_c0_g1_i4.p1  ORF type:complete len:188 (-),score=28.45 TRINITY_DN374_c0_g1_i4:39-602(-)